MKPYREYKVFQDIWISQVPQLWKMRKMKFLFNERSEKGYSDEPLLVASQEHGVILKSMYASRTVEATKDLQLLKLVRVGDFVISLRSFQGGLEYAYYQGIISPAYIVLVATKEIHRAYFKFLAKSKPFIHLLQQCVVGIREGQNISYELLKNHYLPLPSMEEQKCIASYLGSQTQKIDQYISAKQKEISLLEEYKQTIINEAVTKSLNRTVPMKDSGIEWIGQIPAHWEVKRFRHIFDTFKGLNITKADLQETGIPVISYGQIHSKANQGTGIHEDLLRFVDESYLESDKKSLTQEHDFLFADTSEDVAGIGNCVYVNTSRPLFAGYHTIIARPHGIEFPRYLAFLFLSDAWRAQLRCIVNGVKVYSVNQKLLNQTNLLLPPVQEQKEIVAYLDGVCEKLTQTIQNINRQIELLNEYRTTLISDVVTGQVNVCESQ